MSTSTILIEYHPNTPKTIKQNIKKLAQSSSKYFKQKLFSHQNSLELIKYFKLCNFQLFYLHKTQQDEPLLLKCVTAISFPCLKILYLENVKLSSVEALQWIDAPRLVDLHLMENNVVHMKSMAKTKFHFIAKMEIDRIINHHQMSHFTRMKLKPNTEVNNQSKERIITQNPSQTLTSLIEFMFKMESNNFRVDGKHNIRSVEALMLRASQRIKRRVQNELGNQEAHWGG